jgi:hypothetical protein
MTGAFFRQCLSEAKKTSDSLSERACSLFIVSPANRQSLSINSHRSRHGGFSALGVANAGTASEPSKSSDTEAQPVALGFNSIDSGCIGGAGVKVRGKRDAHDTLAKDSIFGMLSRSCRRAGTANQNSFRWLFMGATLGKPDAK